MSLQGSPPHEGGCLCGAIRYRSDAPAVGRITHCHCTMCRRATGAPVVDWVTFRVSDLRFIAGEPANYASSSHARRQFCPVCGTPLTFWSSHDPDYIDVTVGSLDQPEQALPDCHIFVGSRLPWMHLDPELPAMLGDIEGI